MNEKPTFEHDLDLYSLELIRLVARMRGFTAAAGAAGLSQSALTRQVQNVENRLGIRIFERTTRSVRITEAGAVLLRETEAIPNILRGALRRIREDYLEAPREIRIGISRDLALAHLPGLFHSQTRVSPQVRTIVSQLDEVELLEAVAGAGLDLGILTVQRRLPAEVDVTHRIDDRFLMVTPGCDAPPPDSKAGFKAWVRSRTWLLPPRGWRTRELIDEWAGKLMLELKLGMELDDFDLMIHLVAMGMGSAVVPRRALSSFRRKGKILKVKLPVALARDLVVVVPKHARTPEHVQSFVQGILFS